MPDLKRLYAVQAAAEDQPPVVLLHGFMGARLRDPDTGEEVWPGADATSYRKLAQEIDPHTLRPKPDGLEPYALAGRVGNLGLDEQILSCLEDGGRYTRAEPGIPPGPGEKPYYLFLYDWRQDNIESVRRLDRFLEQIRIDHDDPSLKVDVVAHGIGGLITRYYLRYGTLDTLDDNDFPVNNYGARYVRRVILLGVPNLGTTAALRVLLQGWPATHGSVAPEILATMPSTFQALPHPITTGLVTTEGERLKRDLFEARTWRDFEWSIYAADIRQRIVSDFADPRQGERYLAVLDGYFDKTIERARRFVWSLTVPAEQLPVRYITLGGTCDLTPRSLLVEHIGDQCLVRLWPSEVSQPVAGVDYDRLMLEPGDGVVTKSSLLARHVLDPTVRRHKYSYFPMDYALFLCERHERLTSNLSFQNNLLHALLSVDPR